jgi:hypothetical protein
VGLSMSARLSSIRVEHPTSGVEDPMEVESGKTEVKTV